VGGLHIARSSPREDHRTLAVCIGLPDFLQQNTGDFCLSMMFVKDNMMLFHVYVFVQVCSNHGRICSRLWDL